MSVCECVCVVLLRSPFVLSSAVRSHRSTSRGLVGGIAAAAYLLEHCGQLEIVATAAVEKRVKPHAKRFAGQAGRSVCLLSRLRECGELSKSL